MHPPVVTRRHQGGNRGTVYCIILSIPCFVISNIRFMRTNILLIVGKAKRDISRHDPLHRFRYLLVAATSTTPYKAVRATVRYDVPGTRYHFSVCRCTVVCVLLSHSDVKDSKTTQTGLEATRTPPAAGFLSKQTTETEQHRVFFGCRLAGYLSTGPAQPDAVKKQCKCRETGEITKTTLEHLHPPPLYVRTISTFSAEARRSAINQINVPSPTLENCSQHQLVTV